MSKIKNKKKKKRKRRDEKEERKGEERKKERNDIDPSRCHVNAKGIEISRIF